MKNGLNGVWEYRCPAHKYWRPMSIPNNWETGGLRNYKGKVLFRKPFVIKELKGLREYWLSFNGVDYKARAWLNGKPLGTHTGYFQPFEFMVTKYLRQGKNILLVEVDSCPENTRDWPENKKVIKGVFGHHDIRPGSWHSGYGQDHSTGGIWNTVEIKETDKFRIKNILVTPRLNKDYSRAKVDIKIDLGSRIIKKTINIKKPKLWWTWDQGKPNLYRLRIAKKEIVFGIREIKFDKNQNLYLNGRKIFVRGSNIIPEEYLSQYTKEKIEKDLHLAKNANINALRLHAHINRQEFYEACDRSGILVWQDFPLQWEYKNSIPFTKEAQRQCADMVNLLYNHPCIFFLCCHNEPIKSRNRLDPILAKTILRIDKTRPVITSSDFKEHPYPGWFVGRIEYFTSLPGKPLVTEFGAQALPGLSTLKRIFPKKDLWPPNWRKWAYHNFVYEQTFHIAGIDKGKSINEFIGNSQTYQARLIKFAIENYRAHKFSEITGLFHFMFVDPWPCISYSVLDYFRKPKKGYQTLKEVYQPVLLIYLPERAAFTIGDSLRGMFYLVNDYPYGFKNARLKIRLGNYTYPAKKIDIQPNSCIVANKLVYPLPLPKNLKEGEHRLILELYKSGGRIISRNTYTVVLKRIPEGLLEYNAVLAFP